ncbi:hypothetical protein MCOR27_009569 [Pyricularia oryzae]|uniref:Bud22 domain-containing protein n=2 Tax=Pyricularia TaxID=48558 RepID=A0ABQ8P300_PYRGI|nr:hypothetical protein MCOR19_001253 [Pyricularia oryzae]KAI6304555.1 hypothetical protein MCOR33_000411 [Pyricularia grisea]KAI6269812.1 hypothetical protein MCOR27_009569 [Pyricularia oryzae]KAI6286809.1 hypothetical protein MCOR26_000788 [Pyricularia oryzae]KAI6315961.1 hypothetical protein MCOR34_004493 [Pyricularia oryzae]
MPKRKRAEEEGFDKSFERFNKELFRALKVAKGFERQRLAKRVKDVKLPQDKIQRLEQEVEVLKALDLHQAAQAHLCSALLKVKAAAQSPLLPEAIKNGVPKPEISDEERHALHNVTSALYKRNQVRAVVSAAIPALCQSLGVSPPGDKSKAKGESNSSKKDFKGDAKPNEETRKGRAAQSSEEQEDSSSDEDGYESGEEELDDETIDRMEAMLGGSSSEEEIASDDEGLARLKQLAQRSSFDDDISLPGSGSALEEEYPEDDEVTIPSSSSSESDAAPPPPKKAKNEKKAKPIKDDEIVESVALPTLMGGYISGSEEASDVDVAPAPRKNRRGQKARQALAEKKYGDKAKHLGKQKEAGWDSKRGAVDAGDGKPWKRGVRNPLQQKKDGEGSRGPKQEETKKPEKKTRDDDGPLHPSWLAKKKAKQAQENASFQGKKITFD